jgi:hypothetical protein
VWIPGHTGLLRNESADAEAINASSRDKVDDTMLGYRDFNRKVSAFEFIARKNRKANVGNNKIT